MSGRTDQWNKQVTQECDSDHGSECPAFGYRCAIEVTLIQGHVDLSELYTENGKIIVTIGKTSNAGIKKLLEDFVKTMRVGEHSTFTVPSASLLHYSIVNMPEGITLEVHLALAAPPIWDLNPEERLERAKEEKTLGTAFYKEGKFDLAFSKFSQAAKIIVSLSRDLDEKYEHIAEDIKALCVQVHSNLALCQSRTTYLDGIIINCNIVLSLDPRNAKAFFRRGQAYAILKQHESAKEDFTQACNIEPDNKAAQKELEKVSQVLKCQDHKLGKALSKMFS